MTCQYRIVWITSPLVRAKHLADAIGAAHGLSPTTDDRLMEMNFGSWEGVAWDDVSRAELDEWAGDFLHARSHGGESVT